MGGNRVGDIQFWVDESARGYRSDAFNHNVFRTSVPIPVFFGEDGYMCDQFWACMWFGGEQDGVVEIRPYLDGQVMALLLYKTTGSDCRSTTFTQYLQSLSS